MISSILQMKESEAQRGEVFYLQSPSNLVSELGFTPWLRHGNLLPLAFHGPKGLVGGMLPFYYR